MSTSEHRLAPEQRTFVVGTAGHVDHGKSTLVRALTGIDPDRLREEREREMTIDLGFAWLELPGGLTVSVVDVPGHERFIKNMLAGVGGVDAALLVVAADDGPMPQTAEHLAILDLLDVQHGLIVLSRADLVDAEWLALMEEETRDALRGTTLADAPIVPVSAITGAGLDRLREELAALLAAMPERPSGNRPRLPIDRAFTVSGFGTVVTGTLLDGALQVGQELELQPSGRRVRVRGLQNHTQRTERAEPGVRTAVNLSGLEREDVRRGDVLTTPGWLEPTTLLDVQVRLIPAAPQPLEQNDPVDLFVGATETTGHITLLDTERLEPGSAGWAQLRLQQPVAVAAGDRFILRQPSPSVTLGGGRVIDPHPRRHRRFRDDVIQALQTRASGTPLERLLHHLATAPADLRTLVDALGSDLSTVRALVEEAQEAGELVVLGAAGEGPLAPNRQVALSAFVERQQQRMLALLRDHHSRQPLKRGMPRSEVRSRLNLPPQVFDGLVTHLAARETVAERASLLAVPTHEITFTEAQQQARDAFLAALVAEPNSPPGPDAFGIDADLLAALIDTGQVVRVEEGIVYGAAQLATIRAETLALIDANASLSLAQFRDHFGSSRKYAQAVLEYFDQTRVTRRMGDVRVRG